MNYPTRKTEITDAQRIEAYFDPPAEEPQLPFNPIPLPESPTINAQGIGNPDPDPGQAPETETGTHNQALNSQLLGDTDTHDPYFIEPDPTITDPDWHKLDIRIIVTKHGDIEPYHWVVALTPRYDWTVDSICTWYHIYHGPGGYTRFYKRETLRNNPIKQAWRSSDYVTWIPTLAHAEFTHVLEHCVRDNPGDERWLHMLLAEMVEFRWITQEKAEELEWVIMPGPNEPGYENPLRD